MSHDRDRRRMLLAGVGAVGALALARNARAASCGDSGPLAPTGPTMREIYDKIANTDQGLAEARIPIQSLPGSATALYRISSRGVYYLTANILGVAGLSAIEIDADDVEIECDGFTFVGTAGTRSCIVATSPHHAIGVYDGGFSGWQGTCIDLPTSTDCYVEECWFRECDGTTDPTLQGAVSLGDGGTIDDCNVISCACGHLRVGANGIVEECVIRDSVDSSIVSVGPAVVEDNFLHGNSGSSAITIATSAVVISNRLVSSVGISVGADSTVASNDLTGCPSAITVSGSNCTIEDNQISTATNGISVTAAASSVLVEDNNVCACTGTGIRTQGTHTTIESNQVSSCNIGIYVSTTATASLVYENGASNCSSIGIHVEPSQSLVICNSATAAANGFAICYSVDPGNTWGTIVSTVAAGDLGIAGVTLDPYLNFEF